MAEHFDRFKRFDYNTNSSLVLNREGGNRITQNEPTGEPETLKGKIDIRMMGDKIMSEKPVRPNKRAGPDSEEVVKSNKKGRRKLVKDVLALNLEDKYQPRSRQTKILHDNILGRLSRVLPQSTSSMVTEAFDCLMVVSKDPLIPDEEKVNKVIKELDLLRSETIISDVEFMVRTCSEVDDYFISKAVGDSSGGDEAIGVAVVFDEEEGDDGQAVLKIDDAEYATVVQDDISECSDDSDEIVIDALTGERKKKGGDSALQAHMRPDSEGRVDDETDSFFVKTTDIDAHWLQRELKTLMKDFDTAVSTEKTILPLLALDDVQCCENRLIGVLGYDRFDVVKKLVKNRWKIYYMTTIGQAQSNAEIERIKQEMSLRLEGEALLDEIESAKGVHSEGDFARNLRRQAVDLEDKTRKQAERGDVSDDGEGPATGEVEDQLVPESFFDLEMAKFSEGSRTMTNVKVTLSEEAKRYDRKSYDEIVVPPPSNEATRGMSTVEIRAELPEWTHASFGAFTHLNPMQSVVYECAFNKPDKNMLVCAPTGAGKTNVAVLAILAVIKEHLIGSGKDMKIDKDNFKIVYISPMKALVAEQVASFQKRFTAYDIEVAEMTGDTTSTQHVLNNSQIIVATPEKWDIITRRSEDRLATQLVKLLIIDEVHLLHDMRGPVLESIVARTLRQGENQLKPIRLVGLSATLPNYQDVAVFLRCDLSPGQGTFFFGPEHRPVPLEQRYIGIKSKKGTTRAKVMNEVLYEKVLESAKEGNQILVFTHSRRDTVATARFIYEKAMEEEQLSTILPGDTSREILVEESNHVSTAELKDLLTFGISVHHAGLPRKDRQLVEDLYAAKHLPILVSTATLAWGVNLPAHTVIIKGTQVYSSDAGTWVELSPMDVMQMLGRAGRPQYDTRGVGMIITNHKELQFYLSINNMQLPVESQLFSCLPDLLNAEIVSGVVRSRADAVQWLGYTYLFIRMIQKPELYSVDPEMIERDPTLEQVRVDIANASLLALAKYDLIKYDRRSGAVQSGVLGRVASQFYITHKSMGVYNDNLKPLLTDPELLQLVALSGEFRNIMVRDEEKVEVAKLKELVPVPIKGGIDAGTTKVNILLQAYISRLKLDGFALQCDIVYVRQSAGRIFTALQEIALKRGWAPLADLCLKYGLQVKHQMWSIMNPLRQLPVDLPEELLKKLERRDFEWDRYVDLTAGELGELVRVPKLGKVVYKYVHSFPKISMSVQVMPTSSSNLEFEITLNCDFVWDHNISRGMEPFHLLVEDNDNERILYHEVVNITRKMSEDPIKLQFDVPLVSGGGELPPCYFIKLVSSRWLNCRVELPVLFKNLIVPDVNGVVQTALLDLQALPVQAINNPSVESMFSEFATFNSILTQTFHSLYQADTNVLVCAPPNSGKMTGADLVILKMCQDFPRDEWKAVVLVPNERSAVAILNRFKSRFSSESAFPMVVNNLTMADVSTDIRIYTDSELLVCTPNAFDLIQRRWRSRKVLHKTKLVIALHLHLLSDDVCGAALESCLSRTRFINKSLDLSTRICAFSASLSNAKDVADWLGCPSAGYFNFSPGIRPVPVEIAIQGLDIVDFDHRLRATLPLTYRHIRRNAPRHDPVLVFVPDRKQARIASIDLLMHERAAKRSGFLNLKDDWSREKLEKEADSICREKMQVQAILGGVGYLHEGSTSAETRFILSLYKEGVVKVLVVTAPLVWSIDVQSKLVVIQDTQRWWRGSYMQYPIADLLQMLSKAGRLGTDKDGGVALLCCQSNRKLKYKKSIFEPQSVESVLDQKLTDLICAEIVSKTIQDKQECMDWLTWSYYYRRISRNPNFYGLTDTSKEHVADFLSELVENSCAALADAQCIEISPDNDMDLSPLNLGLIAAFYYVDHSTVEVFHGSSGPNDKKKKILDMISAAAEFEFLPLRSGEGSFIRGIAVDVLGIPVDLEFDFNPHAKALALINAHLRRVELTSDMEQDAKWAVAVAHRLLQALVDVLASSSWYSPAIIAMELCQMIVQAVASRAVPLYQLPFFDEARMKRANELGVVEVPDILNCDDAIRDDILKGLSEAEIATVASASNQFPVITPSFELEGLTKRADGTYLGKSEESAIVKLTVKREIDEDDEEDVAKIGVVYCPLYPALKKMENWWISVAIPDKNELAGIKRNSFLKVCSVVNVPFDLPSEPGDYDYVIEVRSDSHLGADRQLKFSVTVD
eukprot:GHVH01004364.1.p1 GENE.GHVH01004364.1~~GHVH01004364.1.p1  ORF type:complete len:2220 (+),score=424.86 GHVH01004364.1:55-6660(+)